MSVSAFDLPVSVYVPVFTSIPICTFICAFEWHFNEPLNVSVPGCIQSTHATLSVCMHVYVGVHAGKRVKRAL